MDPTNQNDPSPATDHTVRNDSEHLSSDTQPLITLDAYKGPPILLESEQPDSV